MLAPVDLTTVAAFLADGNSSENALQGGFGTQLGIPKIIGLPQHGVDQGPEFAMGLG